MIAAVVQILFRLKKKTGGGYETLSTERLAATAPSAAGNIKVTINGAVSYSGTDLKAAWEKVSAETSSGSNVCIELASGTYDLGEEQLAYNGAATIEIKGLGNAEYGSDVLIKTALKDLTSEQSRSAVSFRGSGNLILENLRIENTYAQTASDDAQFEIIGYDGSGYVAGYNCSFISGQDTMRTTGKAWFYHCYIEGDVDFLWMEKSGKVALYEDCRIRAINSRTNKAYFTAPRVTASSTASYYKGLVVYNSKLEAETGLKTVCLGRNPWGTSSEIYNNVSIVGCKFYGTLTKEWNNKGNSNSNIIFSGFNTDSYFSKNSNGNVYSSATVSDEFAGRNNILNRMYSGDFGIVYRADDIWDVAALATEKQWNVEADSSLNLLPSEKDCSNYSYDFVNGKSGTFTTDDGNITVTTTNNNNGSHGVFLKNGDKIEITMKNPGKITFYGCQFSSANALSASDSTVISTKVTKCGEGVDYFYADDSETTITFTATATNYIHGVEIKEFPVFVQASTLTISGSSPSILVRQTLQLTGTFTPSNTTITTIDWSSNNESVATVNDKGVVVGISQGSATITGVAQDGSGVKGTYVVTVVENTKVPTASNVTYNLKGGVGNPYYSDDTFLQFYGKSDNGGHGLVVVNDSEAKLMVAGTCTIALGTCAYDNACTITVTDSSDKEVAKITHVAGDKLTDSTEETVNYTGAATTLTFKWSGAASASTQSYIHYITVTY